MKLFRRLDGRQSPSGPVEGPAPVPVRSGHLGAAWATLSLDDFGIIGTHHLPLDWLGDDRRPPEDASDASSY